MFVERTHKYTWLSTHSFLGKLLSLWADLTKVRDVPSVLPPCGKHYCLAGLHSWNEADVTQTLKRLKDTILFDSSKDLFSLSWQKISTSRTEQENIIKGKSLLKKRLWHLCSEREWQVTLNGHITHMGNFWEWRYIEEILNVFFNCNPRKC